MTHDGMTEDGTAENTAPRTALITGASAGIGKCFAQFYAAKGYDLILVARRRERLTQLAGELAAAHGVHVEVIAADLSMPLAPESIWREVELRHLKVDVLINNAGYGLPERYVDYGWTTHRDFIQVMMTAYADLTHRALPPMIARGYGRIINVASLAGLAPGTVGHTLYGASKAFLIKMSESLALETRGTGVHVTAINPGFTWSEFHDVSGTRESMKGMPGWMWMKAEDVVREAFEANERGEATWVPGRMNRFTASVLRHLPPKLALALSGRRAAYRGPDA